MRSPSELEKDKKEEKDSDQIDLNSNLRTVHLAESMAIKPWTSTDLGCQSMQSKLILDTNSSAGGMGASLRNLFDLQPEFRPAATAYNTPGH